MDQLKYIVWSQDHSSQELTGGKAAALSALASSSMQSLIPAWFSLNKDAFLTSLQTSPEQANQTTITLAEDVKIELQQAITKLQELAGKTTLFAVRSSAIGEDGTESSYAGQLLSILNVTPNQIEDAVQKVWVSALAEHINTYQKETQQTTNKLLPAVLIQVMVPARVAGVGFSVNPVNETEKQLVISACSGLGDKLVSGEVDGDTYYCDRSGHLEKQVCESTPLLTTNELSQISQLLIDLENFFQAPQDVEWAYADQQLWLLQSRPITTLKNQTTQTNNLNQQPSPNIEQIIGTKKILWDNSNIVESYSGITSPLTFSFARYVYENVYTEFCQFMGVGSKKIVENQDVFRNLLGSINGHVYYNLLHWYKWLSLFPGFSLNRRFMEQMMGVGEELPEEFLKPLIPVQTSMLTKITDAIRLTRSGFGLFYNAIVLKWKVSAFNKRLDEALSIPTAELKNMPLDALCAHYRELEQKLLRHWDAPLINDFLCMMAFGLSRKLLQKYGGDDGLAYHRDMLIGQGDIISAEPAKRIRAMAQEVSTLPELTAILSSGDKDQSWAALQSYPKISSMVNSYLDKFGDRCLQELKLESPTMTDEPSTLFSSIGHLATRLQQGSIETKSITKLPSLESIIGVGWWRYQMVSRVSRWAKNLVSGRENLRFERTRVFGRVRQIFVQVGKRFTELNLLENEKDIFYLEVHEILGLIEGSATFRDIAALVAIRKKEYEQLLKLPAPPSRLTTQGAVSVNLMNLVYEDTGIPTDHEYLEGMACCQGIVRAKVRVITNPRQAELKSGEIMVAQFTDPGWITLFANAAGILVERGSLLSHSAIVARELNIPAIVGLKGVMQWLKTGDVVEMDGGTGKVVKIIMTQNESNDEE